MTRVQIPAYTERWMMGDRYGVIVKTAKRGSKVKRGSAYAAEYEVAYVKLDKSGKTVIVNLKDCTEVV